MNDVALFRILGASAIAGGLMRMTASFVPWSPGADWLEGFYFAIDVALLFGLMGIYLADRGRLGVFGFIAFAIAETGTALIVGPDAREHGIDFYQVGALVILIGLSLLGIVMLMRRAGSAIVAASWLAAAVLSVGGALSQNELGVVAGGVSFGAGFAIAGWRLVSPGNRVEDPA